MSNAVGYLWLIWIGHPKEPLVERKVLLGYCITGKMRDCSLSCFVSDRFALVRISQQVGADSHIFLHVIVLDPVANALIGEDITGNTRQIVHNARQAACHGFDLNSAKTLLPGRKKEEIRQLKVLFDFISSVDAAEMIAINQIGLTTMVLQEGPEP